jgi:hypothetical protein
VRQMAAGAGLVDPQFGGGRRGRAEESARPKGSSPDRFTALRRPDSPSYRDIVCGELVTTTSRVKEITRTVIPHL